LPNATLLFEISRIETQAFMNASHRGGAPDDRSLMFSIAA
jgi:hypothetical protein|tara:strand:- start:470 stop:589 length:120 start_codon:yes stop_codon:yes gene_type:complete